MRPIKILGLLVLVICWAEIDSVEFVKKTKSKRPIVGFPQVSIVHDATGKCLQWNSSSKMSLVPCQAGERKQTWAVETEKGFKGFGTDGGPYEKLDSMRFYTTPETKDSLSCFYNYGGTIVSLGDCSGCGTGYPWSVECPEQGVAKSCELKKQKGSKKVETGGYMCMEPQGNDHPDGKFLLKDCLGSPNQKWSITPPQFVWNAAPPA